MRGLESLEHAASSSTRCSFLCRRCPWWLLEKQALRATESTNDRSSLLRSSRCLLPFNCFTALSLIVPTIAVPSFTRPLAARSLGSIRGENRSLSFEGISCEFFSTKDLVPSRTMDLDRSALLSIMAFTNRSLLSSRWALLSSTAPRQKAILSSNDACSLTMRWKLSDREGIIDLELCRAVERRDLLRQWRRVSLQQYHNLKCLWIMRADTSRSIHRLSLPSESMLSLSIRKI